MFDIRFFAIACAASAMTGVGQPITSIVQTCNTFAQNSGSELTTLCSAVGFQSLDPYYADYQNCAVTGANCLSVCCIPLPPPSTTTTATSEVTPTPEPTPVLTCGQWFSQYPVDPCLYQGGSYNGNNNYECGIVCASDCCELSV